MYLHFRDQKKHFEKRRDYLLKRLGAHGAAGAESNDEVINLPFKINLDFHLLFFFQMPEEVAAEDEPVNPLQYRPANMKH